jgi:hypothetical protein
LTVRVVSSARTSNCPVAIACGLPGDVAWVCFGDVEVGGHEVGALSTAAFDANDPASLERFFDRLPEPIDHVLVTACRHRSSETG